MTERKDDTSIEERTTRRRRKKKKKPKKILPLLLILVVALSAYFGFQYTENLFANNVDVTIPGEDDEKDKKDKGKKISTVLMIGTDQRRNEPARADALILAVFNRTDKELDLISVPRDTRAQIPGRRVEKINHAHAYGGADLTKQAIEELLDIKIDSYVETNFVGFANMVDIIGGIEFDVERRMYYVDNADGTVINLQAGPQTLDGDKALQYVRFRNDSRGDLGRVERQQRFLKELADQMLTLGNVTRIPSLVRELNNNVKTDMPITDMVTLANTVKDVDLNNLNTTTLPGTARTISGISYYILDEDATKELLDEKLDRN
ncbi:LCP family protein required for cell wall assembly [Desulfitispora alkaliphila]|uniref:LCP family protein n=1 Tax=Desulfitispora alkaliphila TaxID=622674 RepID=UPI003D25B9EC